MEAGDGQAHRRGAGSPGGACLSVSIDNAPSTEGDLNLWHFPSPGSPHRVITIGDRTARPPGQQPGTPGPFPTSAQIIGGRPARVIRHAVRADIGRRQPGSIRQPSANPDSQARNAASERSRTTVSVNQSSR